MKSFGIFLILALFSAINGQSTQLHSGRVICYYNSTSFVREGLGKLIAKDIEPALSLCSHLVYGYAGIDADTNKVKTLDENVDLDKGKGYYRTITSLKSKFPHLKVLLSVGGNADPIGYEKYLTLLEDNKARDTFIKSVYTLIQTYEFDGIDVAWQFPENKPVKIHSSIGSVWKKFKKVFSGDHVIDEKAEEHKQGFVSLIREIRNLFRTYTVSLTVLPNVNSSLFYDIPALINNIDFVNLAAFDFETPKRQPIQADYPAPVYELNDRNAQHNLNFQVLYWLSYHCPPSKINVGIPTYGRIWKMTSDSGITGVPPVKEVTNEVEEGPQSLSPGLLSYPEICAKLINPSNTHLKGEYAPLRKVNDPTKRFGTYAFRLPNDNGEYGLWVGFEDPDTAAIKADYALRKNLGGIAIYDLSYDDFRGTCTGEKYPILRAAKYALTKK